MSWMFLTFIASICWGLDNLVSTLLPLEVQSWGRWWSSIIFQTSADMTTLGHCSRQVESGRKLMGQPLVHPQKLGSLVGVFSCFLVRDEQGLVAHFQATCLGPFWAGTLLHFSTFSWATWPFLCLGLFPTSWDSWAYKMGIKNMLCHGFFTPHGLLVVSKNKMNSWAFIKYLW